MFPTGEKGWGRLGPGWAVGTSTHRCPEFACVHSIQSLHVSTRWHQIHPHRNGGWERGQEPSSRGLMRPELKPVSHDQCERMLHSLPAQQLTCVLGAFVPAQLSDGLLLALRPPPMPPTPHLLKTRPWQGPRPGECGRGSCCPQPRSAPACPASRGWHVGTRSVDRQV